jgi:hypothetical protein
MADDFIHIKMTGLDDSASCSVERGSAIFRMVINLSAPAPAEWAQYFNHAWKNHFYMMKRRAEASGSVLNVECVPDELEKDHVPELKKVIDETNRAYANYHAQRQQQIAADAARTAADAEKLASIKKSINFD